MRILIVSQDYPPSIGGAQTYTYELAKRLFRRCDALVVIAPFEKGCLDVDAKEEFSTIRVRGPRSLFPFLAYRHIRKFVSENNGVDAIFNVQWPTAVSTAFARKRGLDFKMVVAAHGRELLLKPYGLAFLNDLRFSTQRRILKEADLVLAVSNYTADLVESNEVPRSAIRTVHNGTDAEHFARTANGRTNGHPKTILTVSRLVERKGIDTVIKSLPEVIKSVPHLRYVIAGSGPEKKKLQLLAGDLQVEKHIDFVGSVPYADLPEFYNDCDVFVMPSKEVEPDVEGFGIVFLEANACAKPVIGANTGGIPDAIIDGETGLLVNPDDHAQLAQAIIKTLTNKAFAEELGRQGYDRVHRESSWDHVADRCFAFLSE